MSVSEIIISSSDEENDAAGQIVPKSTFSKVRDVPELKTQSNQHPIKTFDFIVNLDEVLENTNKSKTVPCKRYYVFNKPKLSENLIEVVDLGVDDNNDADCSEPSNSSKTFQVNNSKNNKEKNDSKPQAVDKNVTENPTKIQKDDDVVEDSKSEKMFQIQKKTLPTTNKINSDFFNEFVDLCGSLEDDENDKERLMNKLKKRFEKADPRYVKSEAFKNLIEMNKKKLRKKNLYLVAKEISSELNFNKNVVIKVTDSKEKEKESQANLENVENVEIAKKKRTKMRLIRRIKNRLNELGMKIKELEEQEVDFNDDESTYIILQKYRQKFCTIYEKLCKSINQRSHNQKIYFTESKYPAINKCIEKWLNETQRFPDFVDILKLLETHSSSLGLPSNKNTLRNIAIEIFQNVGVMLKRRRCCDMWDSFFGFLGNSKDPSIESPELKEKLKKNFEVGVKKEQEIIDYYVKVQEKEQLKSEEVSDKEVDKSPVESEEEEEEEDEVKKSPEKATNNMETPLKKEGESKNNFKNCKSLGWRSGNKLQKKGDAFGFNNNTSVDVEKPYEGGCVKGEPSNQKKRNCEFVSKMEPRKKVCVTPIIAKVESLQRKENIEKKQKEIEVIDVLSCQIKPNYEAFYKLDFFDEFCKNKKDFRKKEVFRDLTNVGNLMKISRKIKDYPTLFSRPIFCSKRLRKIRRNIDIIKFNNFKVQKCGSNHDEDSKKRSVRRNSRSSKSKEYSNNSDGREESAYFSGSGNEENNNGDENKKKNGDIDKDEEENQNEEDEEEENDTEENLHSKNNIYPKIKKTDTTVTQVKTLEDINGSSAQVTNQISEVNETKDIQIEENTKVEINKKDFRENEIHEEVKENTGENANNGQVKIKEKISSNSSEKNKTKTKFFDVKRKRKKVVEDIKNVENVKSESEEFVVIREDDEEAIFIEQLNPIVEIKTPSTPRRSSCESNSSLKSSQTQSYVQSQKLYEVETIVQRMRQQNSNQSPSDEERVKRFLLNSPSSISITPPKKLQCKNPLSQEALQALETLKNLKGISATRVVRGKPESEDDVIVIGESSTKSSSQIPNPRYQLPPKQRRFDQNSTNVHTTKPSQSRLPAPQVNQSNYLFNNCHNQPNGQKSHDSSSIKISNVWGALSLKVYESISNNNNNLVAALDSSSRQRRSKTKSNKNLTAKKKKQSNQPVEYVVLD